MKKYRKVIIYSTFGIFLIVLIIKNYSEVKEISENGVYVIGKIDKVRGAYQGRKAFVSYKYRGQYIKSNFVSSEIYLNDEGKRYFFKLNPQHPDIYQVEYKIGVPDTLQEAPYNGWDALPIKAY